MINTLYCANDAVFDGLMLSLMSAAKHTTSPITAYLLTMDLTDINPLFSPITKEQTDILDKMMKEKNPESSVILVDGTELYVTEMKDSENNSTTYTPYTILRLFADMFDFPDTLLYLDVDTMINGDLCEFQNYDISDYEFAGVVDFIGQHFIAKDYINAGVLYLNLAKIKETGLFKKARLLCKTKKMPFPDQDAINEVVLKKFFLPPRFNEQSKLKEDTIVHHFSKNIVWFPLFRIVNVKPWQVDMVHKRLKLHVYDDLYTEYKERRSLIPEDVAPTIKPVTIKSRISRFKKLDIDLKEVVSYATINGGIFRKKSRKDKSK